ncbi:MAG: hypothetical protein WCY37_00040 [Candidatus Dojkabacteria bacterium]|jgi:hypothetical protein
MKNLFSLLIASTILMFPLATYAAVNITLREADTGTVAIDIDTETDTLESISLPISYSEGVEITDVTEGDVTCAELGYTESEDTANTIVVTCTLDSATALDGILANIAFTSTADTPITFEVVESDKLDLGTLTLGQTVSLEQTSATSTAEDVTTTEEELPTTEEDLFVTTETPTTTTDGDLLSSITEYLPYVLIAGSVILLISIVVILLGKKKGPKQPKVKKDKKGDPKQMSPVMGGEPQSERSLKDMVNNPESAPAQTTSTQPASTQEPTPTPIPMSQNAPQAPAQPAYTPPQQNTPPISSASQEEDLQEILQRESSVPTAMGDNTPQEMPQAETPEVPQPNQGVPFSTGFSAPQQQDGPENIMPEAPQPQTNPTQEVGPVTSAPETEAANTMHQSGTAQDLQGNINGQINQINGGVIPTQQPPMEPTNPQQPEQAETQAQMPPITLQQNPNTDNTPEEMPPVPPTM